MRWAWEFLCLPPPSDSGTSTRSLKLLSSLHPQYRWAGNLLFDSARLREMLHDRSDVEESVLARLMAPSDIPPLCWKKETWLIRHWRSSTRRGIRPREQGLWFRHHVRRMRTRRIMADAMRTCRPIRRMCLRITQKLLAPKSDRTAAISRAKASPEPVRQCSSPSSMIWASTLLGGVDA